MNPAKSTLADERTLTELYRTYVTMIRARCRRVLNDESLAEDVTQEAFMLLFQRMRDDRAPDQPAAFLYRAATTRSLNALRNRRRREVGNVDAETVQIAGPSGPAVGARLDLDRVLAVVDEELATLAVYYYVDHMSQDEIAEMTGIHRRTVSRRLDDFRAEGQKILTKGEARR